MNYKDFQYIFIGIYIFGFLLDQLLSWLNESKRTSNLPEEAKDIYNEEKYQKSQNYHSQNFKVGQLASVLSFTLTLCFLIFGWFGKIDIWTRSFTENYTLQVFIFFGILGLGSGIIGLPFSLYTTFVVEEKYGFNKMTVKTFILDKIKGAFLGIIIGAPLLALIIWIYEIVGQNFWVYAWAIIGVFSLFMMLFYTSLILPIFNKLTPLPNGELRTMIENYCKKVNFPLTEIMIMDGSKRSSKANAFFSGMGSQKKIVLFDTLLKNHNNEEVLAVLAHEVGHYKKKHVRNGFFISIMQMGLMLFLISLIINNHNLSLALGADEFRFHLNLLAVSFLFSPISLITGIMMNVFSRKNEYEADKFAKDTYNGKALSSALKRLTVDSLSNLTPHHLYVFFHYSHPPILKRLKALNKN